MDSSIATACLRCLLVLAMLVLLAAGCDNVPTFQELTGQEVEGTAPEQAIADQGPSAPPTMPEGPPPAAKSPQQIIDEFLATESRLRTNAMLEQLAGLDSGLLQQLTVLNLEDSQINDLGSPLLPKFPAVEELNLAGTSVTNAGMPPLANVASLKKVNLDRLFIDGEGLAALKNHQQLRELSLTNTPISDAAFQHLQKMDGLEVLRVSGTRNLQGHGFDELVKNRVLTNLRELQAGSTGFGYYGLRNVKQLPALEILIVPDAEVSDQMTVGIATCRNLRVVDLSRNPIGNDSLKLLSRLDQLETLKVNHCAGITGEGLVHLKGMKSLKVLELNGCRCAVPEVQTLKEKFLKNTTIHFNNEVF